MRIAVLDFVDCTSDLVQAMLVVLYLIHFSNRSIAGDNNAKASWL